MDKKTNKFVSVEEKIINANDQIVFENKTDSNLEVGVGVIFHESGLYDISISENRAIVTEVASWRGQPELYPRRWIPVTEGLPKYGDEVIVSVCDETGDTKYNYTSYGWLTPGKEYWIVNNEINYYVVAWMPLPKPYERSK